MGKAFDTFPQYAFGHYEGQIEDRGLADIISRLADGSDIGYGLAVSDLGNRSAALVDEYTTPDGITVRESIRDNAADGTVAVYPEDHEMSVMRVGRIWVKVADGCAVDDPVYVVPGTGALVSTEGANTLFPNARFISAANAGEMALVQLNGR